MKNSVGHRWNWRKALTACDVCDAWFAMNELVHWDSKGKWCQFGLTPAHAPVKAAPLKAHRGDIRKTHERD